MGKVFLVGLMVGLMAGAANGDVFVLSAGEERVIDFGPDGVGGYPVVSFGGTEGTARVRIAYATHPDGLGPKGDFWHETRANYMGADLWLPILPASTDRFDVFEQTGAGMWRAPLAQGLVRYAKLSVESGAVTVKDVSFVNDGIHSEEPVVGSFSCSDTRVNGVWQASVRTCQLAAIPAREKPLAVHGVHTNAILGPTYAYLSDGAKRDRLVWSGDLWFAQGNMYAAFAPDSPYMRGSIRMLAENRTPDGYVQACPFPESHGPLKPGEYGPFASDEFAAWFIPVLCDHVLHTGDMDLAREMRPVVRDLVAYLDRHTAPDGIFEQRLETCKHSCGLAVGGTSLHHRSYMNILNWLAYRDAARLAAWLGDTADATAWTALAERTARAVRAAFWDAEKGHFRLSREESVMGFEANALALASRFATPDEAARILPQLTYNWHGKFQLLAIRGAFAYDQGDKAMALVSAHNWYKYLAPDWKGLRTVQECCNLLTKGWGDEAHPDACLAGVFTEGLLGVRPLEPGYRTFAVTPHPTASVTSAKGVVPTPYGPIEVSWRMGARGVETAVKNPPGTHCVSSESAHGRRTAALPASAWSSSEWLSAKDAPVETNRVEDGSLAAKGTSWFAREVANEDAVVAAKWMTAGLGVYDVYVNGRRIGDDFLKPGFTHYAKTKYAFTYDVTDVLRKGKGEANVFAAEVSAGWWRDKIVTPAGHMGFMGKKSAFRGVLELTYADGSKKLYGTNAKDWKAGVVGPVTAAAIFDGEHCDARLVPGCADLAKLGEAERNDEFKGEILPTDGAEVVLRRDLTLTPKAAYVWKGVGGVTDKAHGKVKIVRAFAAGESIALKAGETLVVDFGQNCAAVPAFSFSARRGTVLTALPAEMLNDRDGDKSRGNDGPEGSVYRENLRAGYETGRLVEYTFAGDGVESYMPRFSFFGYRYLSVSASDDVTIASLASIPVTSIAKEMELGRLEVGEKDLNRFIQNVYWGQLSNYLSVPTDCPQRNERLGWSADTQVFSEAGTYNADTRKFLKKFTRDLRDSRCKDGGYPSVAPFAQYGNETFNLGWADVGVIVPWTVWKQFGDCEIVAENYEAMSGFVRKLDETKYDFEGKLGYIYADWLSYEKFETCGNRFGSWQQWKDDPDAKNYRRYLAACYWLYDARLMAEMAAALGKADDVAWFEASAARALAHIRATFVEADGQLLKPMRDLQTACVFALRFGIVEGDARAATKATLLKSIKNHGDCLQTGFIGTSFLMDVLAAEGEWDVAYGLLFQHKNPSWLYSVDQGATTVWERWNSYVKDTGFGPVGMNSFNHYAYGAVLAWIYKHAAGIECRSSNPGFKTIVMAPIPDRRLGFVKAEYKSAAGLVRSAWRYEGAKWIWTFTVPKGAVARVTLPGESAEKIYQPGTYVVER